MQDHGIIGLGITRFSQHQTIEVRHIFSYPSQGRGNSPPRRENFSPIEENSFLIPENESSPSSQITVATSEESPRGHQNLLRGQMSVGENVVNDLQSDTEPEIQQVSLNQQGFFSKVQEALKRFKFFVDIINSFVYVWKKVKFVVSWVSSF